MVLGDKSEFAIEYSFADKYPNNMGFGRIWIDSEFIGTYKDLIYLGGYLLGTLNEFKRARQLRDDLKNLTKEELFNLFFSGDYEYSDDYLVRGSTFTDDFSIWSYKLDDRTFILWKILRTDSFDDLNDYKEDIFLKSALMNRLNDVINQLELDYKEKGIIKA